MQAVAESSPSPGWVLSSCHSSNLKIQFQPDFKRKANFIHCRYLLPEKAKGGKQKTGVCRKTVCPKWEHTMAWDDISLDTLWERSLELTVWDHDRLGHNEILGGVRFNIGKGMYKR